MSNSFKRWIYHAELEPKIINSEDFEKHEKEGWADSPAKFAKIKDFGVDENDPSAVQVLGEALEGVRDRLNGELNIDEMSGKDLREYALKHFNADLSGGRSLPPLREELRKLIASPSGEALEDEAGE